MDKNAAIDAVLSAHAIAAYRHPIEYRVVGWTHDATGAKLGAGSSFPWPGTYTPCKAWTRVQDGGASSVGRTFETREALVADQDAALSRSQAQFREALQGMTLAKVRDQLAYWEAEAAKKAKVPA